jgi:hypothetical protein
MTPSNNTTNGASRKVVFNPYARKRPRTDSSTQRSNVENSFEAVQQQPFERAACNQQPRSHSQATSTDNYNARPLNTSSNHVHSEFSLNHCNSTTVNSYKSTNTVSQIDPSPFAPVGRVNAASAATTARPDDGHKFDNKRDSLDSLNESSIEWDEAIRVTDSATQISTRSPSHEAANETSMPISPWTNRNSANQACCSSSPVVDLAQNAVSSGATAGNHEQALPSLVDPSTSSVKKPPQLPSAGRQHQHNMSSLRPAAWSNNGTDDRQIHRTGGTIAPLPQNLSQQQGPGHGQVVASPSDKLHPSIKALPNDLRFSPEVIQPAKDGRTPELVKHAQLGQPLANGWKLFDHQKRAICMGLRMRRAIIGLDMGLGECIGRIDCLLYCHPSLTSHISSL